MLTRVPDPLIFTVNDPLGNLVTWTDRLPEAVGEARRLGVGASVMIGHQTVVRVIAKEHDD